MTKSFRRKVVLDGIPYIVEQDHLNNSLTIKYKNSGVLFYFYKASNGTTQDLSYRYKYASVVKEIFKQVNIERFPLYMDQLEKGRTT